jgi:hypothetical protein
MADGVVAVVAGTRVVPGAGDMWDLTVANNHDFYVIGKIHSVVLMPMALQPVLIVSGAGGASRDSTAVKLTTARGTSVLVHNIQCRTADGKFAKADGTAGRVGALDERTTLDQLELDGAPVVRGPVTVQVPGVGTRIYDGAVQIDGDWLGVEMKGGTSPLTPRQKAADSWLNTQGNVATSGGSNGGYDPRRYLRQLGCYTSRVVVQMFSDGRMGSYELRSRSLASHGASN